MSLSRSAARKLAKSKGLRSLRKGRGKHSHLTSTYFDTPRHVLRKSGFALRLREDGRRTVQTIQAQAEALLGLQSHHEWTAPIDGDQPSLARISDPELARDLSRRRCENRLRSVFTTEFNRTTMRFRTAGSEIQMAIDEGRIRVDSNGHSREEPICEAELELVSGDPTQMLELALSVCETFDVRLTHLTKAERGYALARPALRPRARKATLVTLEPELSAGAAFRAIASGALEHLFLNEVPVFAGRPGGVHQTRVAMRRLRAALRAFKALLPYDKRKAFNSEFRWFQQRLAPARDWHVFLDETVPIIARSVPDADLKKLRRLARSERRRATQEAIAVSREPPLRQVDSPISEVARRARERSAGRVFRAVGQPIRFERASQGTPRPVS